MPDRAVVFVDGNNWFHALEELKLQRKFALNFAKISEKLLGPRQWVGTRYYVGRLSSTSPSYDNQRRFEEFLKRTDPRITMHFGRVEARYVENEAAREMQSYLYGLTRKIDTETFTSLIGIAKKHAKALVWQEKAVDVMLAVDMVVMATTDEYDAAYLLSADGDFTGAVDYVRKLGKKVFAASALQGAQLAKAVNSFIRIERSWFDNCY